MDFRVFLLLSAVISTGQTALLADSFRIAFGSCYDQDKPSVAVFHAINKAQPQLMVLTGDNIYVDSEDPDKFARDYTLLGNNKGYMALKETTDILAIWDDHDYGLNDGGKDFPAKQLAKRNFVDFFGYKELQDIPQEQGIWHARRITAGDKTIQVIMLDTRWYRDDLLTHALSEADREGFQLGPYRPHTDNSKTLLGPQQWRWLETQLKQPADLNIIVSSIQVIAEFTAWETWANFPHERQRLLSMIDEYSAGKAVILSGDVHRAETSQLALNNWTLFELTASGLSADMYPGKPNIHRIGEVISQNQFGLLDIEFTNDGLVFEAGYFDQQGKPLTTMQLLPVTGDTP